MSNLFSRHSIGMLKTFSSCSRGERRISHAFCLSVIKRSVADDNFFTGTSQNEDCVKVKEPETGVSVGTVSLGHNGIHYFGITKRRMVASIYEEVIYFFSDNLE